MHNKLTLQRGLASEYNNDWIITLGTNDLDEATAFYDELLGWALSRDGNIYCLVNWPRSAWVIGD